MWYTCGPVGHPRSKRRGGTGIPVMRNTVKGVMTKWWRWKNRDPTVVSPFYVCPIGTKTPWTRVDGTMSVSDKNMVNPDDMTRVRQRKGLLSKEVVRIEHGILKGDGKGLVTSMTKIE